VLVLLGRTHLYEGHGTDAVVHGIRTRRGGGCRTVVLTNAAAASARACGSASRC
jgi:purine-nucleoside phosphorylase